MLHILFFVSLFSSQGSGGLAPPVEERQVVLHPPAKEINPCCGWLERCLTPLQAKPALVGSNGLEPSTSRLSGVRSNHLSYEPISVAGSFPIGQTFASAVFRLAAGGDEQNRTVDPLLARQVLSQLSYAPILGLCLGESTLFEGSLFRGPSKLNSVRLTRQTHKYLFRSTWMIEPSVKWLGSP